MARTVLFASHFHGYSLLSACLHGKLAESIEVVGVASDDPTKSYCNPSRRFWRYAHEPYEKTMVVDLAKRNGIETYTGRLTDEEFIRRFQQEWQPELCLISAYGQRVTRVIRSSCRFGAFNFHPYCDAKKWPSYRGGGAFEELIADRCAWLNIVMHVATEEFDAGAEIASSPRVFIPPGISVMDLEKLSASAVGQLAKQEVPRIIRYGQVAQDKSWCDFPVPSHRPTLAK